MKKIFLLLQIFFFIFHFDSLADEKLINSLKEGKKIIFIRHAYAPGNGDPNNFRLDDCSTQRNLNEKGIKQSKKIGFFFKSNSIKIDKILSSEWCRCKDTAKIAFGNFKTFNALNSFYDEKFAKNELKQIQELREYVSNWDGKKNLVFITHYVVISAILNQGVSSGEIIVSDKKLNVIGSIKISLPSNQ